MTLRDCMKTAAFLLKLDTELELLEKKQEAEAEDTEIEILRKCAVLVLEEIAEDYVPLIKKEQIQADAHQIPYDILSERAVDVFEVSNTGGRVSFKLYPAFLEVGETGPLTVEYCHTIAHGELDDPLPYKGSKVTERAVAYGIACEYSLLNGMNDEAVLYDKRFRDSMHKCAVTRGEKRVRARRWY